MSVFPEAHTLAALVVPPLQAQDLPEFMNTVEPFAPRVQHGLRLPPKVGDLIETIQRLGIDGSIRHCRWLAALLHHASAEVVAAAEQSLWLVWMQAGTVQSNILLADAVALIEKEDFSTALCMLDLAIEGEADFAELHHQRGLVLASLNDHAGALDAFREALHLNPHHFAAAAGMGHAHVELSHWREAFRAYQQAVRIHPRLPEIAEACSQLGAALGIQS